MDLSTNDARLALVTKYAVKNGLDPAIVAAVCEQESGWNPYAVRFEPAFYQRYILPLNLANPTEAEGRAFSYGLLQIMGQTARELGFSGQFLTQLCDPDTGVAWGCLKLKKCFAEYPDPETALLKYNGGGNAEYGKQVLARVPHYRAPDLTETQGAD